MGINKMNALQILNQKLNKYYTSVDETQLKAILEAMYSYAYGFNKEDQSERANVILKIVCEFFDLSEKEIKMKSRNSGVVMPRQLAMYFIKSNTRMTLGQVGAIFNDMNHATVFHSFKVVNDMIDTDSNYRTDFLKLNNRINEKLKQIEEISI